jgi:hypothetical protein
MSPICGRTSDKEELLGKQDEIARQSPVSKLSQNSRHDCRNDSLFFRSFRAARMTSSLGGEFGFPDVSDVSKAGKRKPARTLYDSLSSSKYHGISAAVSVARSL